MEVFRKSPRGYSRVLLPESFRADIGRSPGEELRKSLTESGIAGVLGSTDRSKVESMARLALPMTILGVCGAPFAVWTSEALEATAWFEAKLIISGRKSCEAADASHSETGNEEKIK
jgi:hypothetical protein